MFRSALGEHFCEDSEIASPENESDAWRVIVEDIRRGSFPDLQSEIERLLRRPDREILEFFRSCAPAWKCKDAADARLSLEVFHSYLDTYAP
jgi:hypothetical protein